VDRSRAALRALFGVVWISFSISLALPFVARAMPQPGEPTPAERVVSETTGEAQLRIPIAAPPGPGGLAPELALSYSSRRADGPVGVGWSLELPEIRCSARFGVPDFASCPRYELGDALLVRDPAAASSFHTVVESFQRISMFSSGGSPWWTVEQPNGRRLTFGQSAAHRITRGGHPARWLLERLEDPFGNRIEFDYAHEPGQEAYLASVRYGAPPAEREIAFVYEARPDARLSFASGVERHLTRRLREIRVLSAGAIYRRYVFVYDAASTTFRSRLASVQEFGTDCTGADPVVDCAGRGLPPRAFRYRDAADVGSGSYSESTNDARYRLPFGDYRSAYAPLLRNGFPVLIGDLDGDGLPDRLEILSTSIDDLATFRILINTGAGFEGASDSTRQGEIARQFRDSFRSLTYAKPTWEYRQIPAPIQGGLYQEFAWNDSMFAMCSVTPTLRSATLSQELLSRGAGRRTSTLAALRASGGAPSAGYFEPLPSVRMADLDSDGRADLVVSLRLAGVTRHFDCSNPSAPLAVPERFAAQTVAVVFRNTGSGWERDDSLATGLPPFDEAIAKSSYQTEVDEPSQYEFQLYEEGAASPCANRGIWGFEQWWNEAEFLTAICHNLIDLAPQFVDFDGDGYLDLAVLERDDPTSFWTGADYWTEQPRNTPHTHVWVQRPGTAQRWQRAPQYDLPTAARPATPFVPGLAHAGLQHILGGPSGDDCLSWKPEFMSCSPNTYHFDGGVRLADVNHDGLVDVVWSFQGQGVLLNTGAGSPGAPASAWCASEPDDAPLVGSACPEAAIYRPPGPLADYSHTYVPVTVGLLADLNGDRFPDYVRLDPTVVPDKTFESWIQTTGGSGPSAWRRDPRFDFHVVCSYCRVPHPLTGELLYLTEVFPRFDAVDLDGDGSDDVIGDTDAFLSRSRHSDLVRAVDNGRGGAIAIEYAAMTSQRDAGLEADAELAAWADAAGPVPLWRPLAVVSRVTATGSNLAPPGDSTDYRYAHPRFNRELRSDLGFGLVRRARTGGVAIESSFYQDPGRSGRTAMRVVKDAGSVVHRYTASWDHVPGVIPGSIAGVYHARLVDDVSANEYGGFAGAPQRRSFDYDDDYGFDFVAQIRTERASSSTTRVLLPQAADFGRWIIGLVRERRDEDDWSSWSSRTEFRYTPEGRIESEVRHRERGDGSPPALDQTQYAYDRLGNLIRHIDANGHAIAFGYDASGTVLTSRTDPPLRDGESGIVTRWTPDPVLAVPVAVEPGYRDEPRSEIVHDAFGRVVETWLTPRERGGVVGARVLASAVNFEDRAAPPYVERFQYANAELDAIRTAVVDDGFGGVWKTIRDAGPALGGAPRFMGSATYHLPAQRRSRTTYDVPCGSDELCRGLTGAAETPAQVTSSDALGRPLWIETPRGTSLSRYDWSAERIAQGRLPAVALVDVVWSQDAKGDLTRRSFDGDRVVAVEECANADPYRSNLAEVACARSGDPNRTLYAYHASGGLEAVRDPIGADREWTSARHQLRYRYDSAGLLMAVDDPDAGSSATFYDGVGNPVGTINARGQLRTTSYDALDRRTRIVAPEGEVAFAYRGDERQLQSESGRGYSKTFDYDGFGHVTRESRYGLGVRQLALSRYDLVGRRTWHTVLGNTVRYEYAGAFLQRVCTSPVMLQLTCADPGATAILSGVSYDAIGRRSALQLPGGVRTFAYADAETRDLREDRFAGASTFAIEALERDRLGNVLDWAIEGPPGASATGSYSYDARNRIASRTRSAPGLPDAVDSFAYDALGNLVTNAGETQRFEHPTKPHALTSRGAVRYEYDASGNLAQAGGRYFRFDSANRLVCVGSGAGRCDLLRAVYDADGERVAEQAGATLRTFVGPDQVRTIASGVDESRVEITAFGERVAYSILESPRAAEAPQLFDVEIPLWLLGLPPAAALAFCLALAIRGGLLAGVARRPACAGLAGALIAAIAVPSPALASGDAWSWRCSVRWVISDAIGSGIAVLDETGQLLHETRYEPFGAVDEGEYHAGSDPMPRRYFGGHPEQAETGLHYMNARWLDPVSGSFLSVDPVVANASDPQSYAAYSYARNNPIQLSDPSGGFIVCWGCDAANELANCNRCSGFASNFGFTATVSDSAATTTSTADVGNLAQSDSAAGAADSVSSPSPSAPSGAAVPGADVGLAAIGDLLGAAGSALARVAEIVAWDLALAVVGIAGNAIGIAAGMAMAIQGMALLNPMMVAKGFESSFWALIPRYGFWSGPGWGKPNLDGLGAWFGPYSAQNPIEAATYRHDYHATQPGADRQLIRDVWSRNDLGPYGQVYRVGLTALFGTGIAFGMDD
jgi:RHS repeat-associated protein